MDSASPRLNGVVAASLTPMRSDLTIDPSRLWTHCRRLLDSGCNGVLLFGTTGEANSFTVNERLELIEGIAASGLPLDRLVVGTGCCAEHDTVTLTKRVLDQGVENVLALPPFYYKSVSDDGLFAFFERVIHGIDDSRMKIHLYHIPQMSGVSFSHALIDRLIAGFPDTIAGIKDSSGDRNHLMSLCESFPGLRIFSGTERFLLDVLEAGGVGCVSATANVTAPLAGRLYERWRTGEAAGLQEELSKIRSAIKDFPLIPALKCLTALRTGDKDWLNLRPPLAPLSEKDAAALQATVHALKLA